jgi:hypothetical protein
MTTSAIVLAYLERQAHATGLAALAIARDVLARAFLWRAGHGSAYAVRRAGHVSAYAMTSKSCSLLGQSGS